LISDDIQHITGLDESEARFSLHGEFDILNKRQLFATLEPYIDSQRLTVDLANATFIDASTVGIFAHIARRRREIDATRFRMINVGSHFRRIFSLCALNDVFDIEAGSLAFAALP